MPDEDTSSNTLTNKSKLFAALAQAQGQFPPIPKDAEVKVYSKPPNRQLLYSYKYADLTTIISCVRPSLSKNGLSFIQTYEKDPALGNGLVTYIMHDYGQELRAGFVPCDISPKADMKAVAGYYTYGKRISLTAALGISADEDVDAGSIEANSGNATERQKPKQHAPQSADEFDQFMGQTKSEMPLIEQLYAIVDERQIPTHEIKELIAKVCGEPKRSNEMTDSEVAQVLDLL